MQLTTLDLVVVVVYMALLSGIGIYFSRRQTSREEYLLGGRSMHWMLLGGSMMATLLSTITFLSVPGEMMRYGIAYLSGIIAMPLFVPVANRVLIPVLRRLPITSVYEYLEKRFDVSFRSLASFLFVLRTVIWMGLIIYTCSFAVAEITGWDLYFTIIATGLVTTFYTTAGGSAHGGLDRQPAVDDTAGRRPGHSGADRFLTGERSGNLVADFLRSGQD